MVTETITKYIKKSCLAICFKRPFPLKRNCSKFVVKVQSKNFRKCKYQGVSDLFIDLFANYLLCMVDYKTDIKYYVYN